MPFSVPGNPITQLNPGRTADPHSNPPSSSLVSASSAPPERPHAPAPPEHPHAPAPPERPQAPALPEWHPVPKIGPGRASDAKISAPEPVPILEFVPHASCNSKGQRGYSGTLGMSHHDQEGRLWTCGLPCQNHSGH